MKVQEGIELVRGLVNAKPLSGLSSMLKAFQYVANEIYAQDCPARLREGGFFSTVAGTQKYSFITLYGPLTPEWDRVRTLRGVYDATLSTGLAQRDYGRGHGRTASPRPDQRILDQRYYADRMVVDVDNERQEIIFRDDPGTTTTKWKSDYYLKAPTLNELSELPVLPGWEWELFIKGVQAYWEFNRLKEAGPIRAEFNQVLSRYPDALERDSEKRNYNPVQGYVREAQVSPQ